MKITSTPSDPLRAGRAAQGETRVRAGSEQATSAAGAASHSINLSAASRETQANDAPFNAAQVEEIKQAIRDGKFKVNAEAIADRFIQIERDLGALR